MVRTQGRWTKFISKAIADRSPQCLSASEQSNSEQAKKTSSKCWNEKVKETVKKIDICDKKGILLCWRPVARPSSVTAINNEDGGKLSQSCNQVLSAFSFFDR